MHTAILFDGSGEAREGQQEDPACVCGEGRATGSQARNIAASKMPTTKSVGKETDAASLKGGLQLLGFWTKAIKTHMYYCAKTTPEGPMWKEINKAKWLSILNHMCNIHEGHGELYPKCIHNDLDSAWIKKDSQMYKALEGIANKPTRATAFNKPTRAIVFIQPTRDIGKGEKEKEGA